MAQLQATDNNRKNVKHYLKQVVGIDMTPMVDLGFLLITFFIFTTTLGEKTTMPLNMPKEGKPIDVPESKTLSILVGSDNRILAYEGMWSGSNVRETDKLEVGNLIRAKQHALEKQNPGNSKEMVVLVKPMKAASYGSLIDVLDEMLINGVRLYAVVDPVAAEEKYVAGL
ncbi:MAG: ExbD/TolR family protein [Flavisolibacter sp.]